MKLAIFCVVLFFALVNADSVQFALQMTGQCQTEVGACSLKGNSQSVTTTVSASTDAVTFSVKPVIGTFATLNAVLSSADRLGLADMSFGTHLSRNHTLNFIAFGPEAVVPGGSPSTYVRSGSYKVLGGTGAFDGATGAVAYTFIVDTASGDAQAFTHGHIFPKAQ